MTVLFYAMRHGITAANQSDVYRGHSNEKFARLSPDGKDVVRQSALWMKRAGLEFPLVMSDDLDRATESRDILKDILQIPNAVTDKRLRPLDVGEFTGKSKSDNPLDKYIKNKALKIPGGESLNDFNKRAAKAFEDIADTVSKLGRPILIVTHGSTTSFLYNNFNDGGGEVGYEGLVKPGGVLMFTSKGLEPLTRKKDDSIYSSPLADGTALSGFVTDEENIPPRECWHCYYFSRDAIGLGGCSNPVVKIDPQLVDRRKTDGTIGVSDQDCCNFYKSKIV